MADSDITELFRRVTQGRDDDAAEALWNIYFERLRAVSRGRLRHVTGNIGDDEDVALSAMNSFFVAAENGRLDQISSRHELWKLLLTIAVRKVHRQAESAAALKRGGNGQAETATPADEQPTQRIPVEQIEDRRVVDTLLIECRERIVALPETLLQKIAAARLEGYSVQEIAAHHDLAVSTIERKLSRIRSIWRDFS